jgi:hypothetical protein
LQGTNNGSNNDERVYNQITTLRLELYQDPRTHCDETAVQFFLSPKCTIMVHISKENVWPSRYFVWSALFWRRDHDSDTTRCRCNFDQELEKQSQEY